MNLIKKYKSLDKKNRIALTNTFFAFLIKGLALIISLYTTPAFISYFNDNVVLGVWYTLLSVLTWVLSFDFGIGNGVRNQLVKDLSNNDKVSARKTISSGIFANLSLAVILMILGVILISIIDLRWLYGLEENIISKEVLFNSTLFVLLGIVLRFFLTTVSSLFYALQKSSINNFLALLISVLQLLFVLVYKPTNPENALISLSIAYVIIANLPTLIAGIILFFTVFKEYVPSVKFITKNHLKSVLNLGMIFFACQILYMLIVNSNEILISNVYGPEFTTQYSFYYKLSSLISMIITLALTPLWSLITKAMNEKQYKWIYKMYKLLSLLGLCTIIIQFLFVPIEQFVMDIWLGDASIKVDYYIAIAFACYGGAFLYQSILSTIVCGLGRMKLQAWFYLVGVIVKFLLIILLHDVIDSWSFVVWTNVIILVPYCIVQQFDLSIFLKKEINKQIV